MPKFIQLPTFHIGESCLWETEGDLIYESDLYYQPIIIPDGFMTDLASIPVWVPEFLIHRNGKHRRAAVVHDWCCRKWSLEERPLADKIFLEIMTMDNVAGWRRYSMYIAVSIMTKFLQLRGIRHE